MQKLFKLIREENVVLFIGAGFSLYTGLPSGNKLKLDLIEEFSELKEYLETNSGLSKMAHDIVNLQNGSRNELNLFLKKVFNQTNYDNLDTHHKLASIPHFKDIITTNYDKTLEIALADNYNLIYKDTDLTYIDKSKTNLFKIHGTIDDVDSIIITKKDYTDLYKNNFTNRLVWSHIKSLLTTKTVLYIGYSHDDDNIDIITDHIHDSLGANFKESYLICPDLKKTKIAELEGKKIKYINTTGEIFINELLDNIRDNIYFDFNSKLVSHETFNKFCHSEKLSPTTKFLNGKNTIESIEPIDGSLNSKFDFKFSEESFKKDELNKFIQDSVDGEIIINRNDLTDFKSKIGNITNGNFTDFSYLKIIRTPNIKGKVDISFEDGYFYKNIKYEIFSNGSKSILKFYFETNSNIICKIKEHNVKNDLSITIKFDFNFKSVNDEINFYECLKRFVIEKKLFKAYDSRNSKLIYNYQSREHRFPDEMISQINFLLEYYQNLKKLEQIYFIKFISVNPNVKDMDIASIIANKVQNTLTGKESEIIINPNQFKEIFNLDLDENNRYNTICIETLKGSNNFHLFKLHNITFKLTYNKIIIEEVDFYNVMEKGKLLIQPNKKITYIYSEVTITES